MLPNDRIAEAKRIQSIFHITFIHVCLSVNV